jgi:signal transduction histidine kinase
VKLPSRLTVLTATLLVLLPALAVLQYRWVGQLGDAARERMQRNLHNAAQQFRDAFDGEVARAFISLQVDSGIVREEAWSRYAERHAAWASTASSPGIVSNIYLIDALGTELRLRRWDGQARVFAAAPWSGALANARTHFRSELAAFASDGRRRFERSLFQEHEALLIAPLVNLQFGPIPAAPPPMHQPIVTVFGYTVIELNLPLIREQLLPALAQRHFSHTDGDGYRVAVIDSADPRKVIYSSPQAPVDPARADVSMPIFGTHHDPIMFLARGASRELREPRNLVVSVIREKREQNVTMHARVANMEGGRWRLLAQHERGSLEAAVGGVRQRNLLVSFGILMLMAVSIGLLTVSSRRAQRLAQQQMEFVAGVSHELRTPVAVIRSAAENLSHGVVGDPGRVRRYGDAIQAEARRLGEMVERVLEFAGIESGRRLVRAPLAVEPLVNEAVGAAVGDDQRYTVERHISGDLPPVLGDASMLRSALQNLLANAIKYGGADGWIGIRAQLSPDKRQVRVTVEDHGGGIAETDLPHIFDPFYRGADATGRQIQGSGLGLALVRRIAEAHGGRVTVSTRAGGGSAFTLHLPAAASSAGAIVFQAANEAAAR